MEAKQEKIEIKLDPKIKELYDRLEEEKRKNAALTQLEIENNKLKEKIRILEEGKEELNGIGTKKAILNTKKKMALQEQLQEKRLQEEIITNKQKRIDALVESLNDNQEIQELDSKSLLELKATLDSLIEGREKRKKLIEKLNEKNRLLMEENEDLKFTRTKLAHDLRSLMSSILGTISLIDLGEREAMESLIPLLKDRCHVFINLLGTINNEEINREMLKIEDIIKVINLSDDKAMQAIQLDIKGKEVPIFADKAALYDVIQNLLNNSVKYSGKSISELNVKIEVTENKGKTVIRISDNGKGIPVARREKIFNLYDRAGLTDKAGKGIGLYMVKKIINLHNGTINYDDTHKSGAQFVIELPQSTR